ncbi:MAG: cysteine desulfurase [Clostridia bacterium]|nr:cysteine desulfurase [Clostridia bacterium]
MAAVYLDNSATTRVCRAAADKAYEIMTETYGNPSSLHAMGFRAEQEMTAARKAVAAMLGVQPEGLIFTSGGTEANNLAILGSVAAHPHGGKHIVTTAVEHSSVAAACDRLEQEGYTVTRLTPDENGCITPTQIAEACRPDTVLVTVMLVNNETGARFLLEQAVPAIRQVAPKAHIHADGVQAAGKLKLQVERWGFDSLSASAHKLHGPKGCGVLYLRRGARVIPRNLGGKQEGGIRCGTEAVPLIAAFGAAVEQLPPVPVQLARYDALRQVLLERLENIPGVRLHLPEGGVPYIIHLSVPGYRSETMLHFLAQQDIYVSSGSACAKGAKSPVLTAMGLPADEIDSALRVSLCRDNTEEDMHRFADALQEAMSQLARR